MMNKRMERKIGKKNTYNSVLFLCVFLFTILAFISTANASSYIINSEVVLDLPDSFSYQGPNENGFLVYSSIYPSMEIKFYKMNISKWVEPAERMGSAKLLGGKESVVNYNGFDIYVTSNVGRTTGPYHAAYFNSQTTQYGIDFDKYTAGDNAVLQAIDYILRNLKIQAKSSLTPKITPTPKPTVTPATGIRIDEVHFPDAAFRKYISENIDVNKDGVLTEQERKSVKQISVPSMGIITLNGIEYFPNLIYLDCNSNQLTSLDITSLNNLSELYCFSNQLNKLNTSGIYNLNRLHCYDNNLTTLDVSAFSNITFLNCSKNQLTTLNVYNNHALQTLHCWGNQLTSLDVSGCSALQVLSCGTNQLSSLNVNDNSALKELSCSSNNLTSLDVSNNLALTYLACTSNQLTNLNVSANLSLIKLYCWGNQLSSLNVSSCTALQGLYCGTNQLTSLNISANPNLQELYCDANQLISLDLNANSALQTLNCDRNQRLITADNGKFDLSTLPGFNVAKTSAWNGGTVEGTVLTVPTSGNVTYTYDCGNGYSGIFILYVAVKKSPTEEPTFTHAPTVQPTSTPAFIGETTPTPVATEEPSLELEILPGDCNGDGIIDGRDLLRLARFISGQDVKINEKAADMNGDNLVDGRDVLRLAKTLAGK